MTTSTTQTPINPTLITSVLCSDAVRLGTPRVFRNLTLFPLIATAEAKASPLVYRTLDEALALKVAHVTEVNNSGSVPELRFVNEGDIPVLLTDGEELIGAKQNRTLNISLLVAGKTELLVPVTCVEAGRWRHTSAEFSTASHSHFASGRAKKQKNVNESMRQSGGRMHDANQGEVWQEIASKAERMQAYSPTSAMSEVFAQHSVSVEEYVSVMTGSVEVNEVGGIFAIGDKVIGLDRYDQSATWQKLLPKLVRSFALDAVDAVGAETKIAEVPCSDAVAFLRRVVDATPETYPALGLGINVRLQASGIVGSVLVVEDTVAHLSAFAVAEAEVPQSATSASMARASARMRVSER